MRKVSIIGAGKVGRVLGRLFHEKTDFKIQDLVCRSITHAKSAAAFIGAGRPVTGISALRSADIFCIATPDDEIASCAKELARLRPFPPGTLVFHCSGTGSSDLLAPLKQGGALIASVHPVKSFAQARSAFITFEGTYCGVEGEGRAVRRLTALFKTFGAFTFKLQGANKPLYHAAAVFGCNYLVVLLDEALKLYAQTEVSPRLAKRIIAPLARETLENVFRLGPARALTGPAARGDLRTMLAHYQALKKYDRELATLYRRLGKRAAALKRSS